MIVFVVLVCLCLFLSYWILIRDVRTDKSPMPYLDLPILGNLLQLSYHSSAGRELQTQLDLIRRFGKYWLRLPVIGLELVISDLPSIQFVLNDNFVDFELSSIRKALLGDVFGDGIFMSNGENWAIQRKLAKPIFSVESRKEMFEVYHKCAANLIKILDDASRSGEQIELQAFFKRFTLDTFGEIGFGYTINSLLSPVKFSTCFDWLLREVDNRYKLPFRKYTHASIWKKNLSDLEDFVIKIIEDRKKTGWKGRTDFLSLLLEMADKGEPGITSKFLRDQLVNFLIAGRDTTAVLIASTLFYLGHHPEVEEKVRKEIDQVIGNSKVSRDHTRDLKYLQMVLDESLRLSPPAVPFNGRIAIRDVTLPNGTKIPKGVTVMYSPWIIHRLTEYWGDDAEEFKPERWEKPLKHPYQFLPFQKGPRICMGMDMAYEEAKCCIAIMYQNGFQFEIKEGKHTLRATVILCVEEGINATVKKKK